MSTDRVKPADSSFYVGRAKRRDKARIQELEVRVAELEAFADNLTGTIREKCARINSLEAVLDKYEQYPWRLKLDRYTLKLVAGRGELAVVRIIDVESPGGRVDQFLPNILSIERMDGA